VTFKTFIFVDLAGFSALTETHGDEAGAQLAKRFEALARASLGTIDELVAMIGDAAFLTSPEPKTALELLARVTSQADAELGFPALRAGLHHGEAIRSANTYFGTAVNIAARVAAEARGGQTLGTATVVEAARAIGLAARSLGVVQLKNLRQSLELFSLEAASGVSAEVVDPVCRMRVVPEKAAAHLQLDGREHWFCSRECLKLFLEPLSR